MAAHYHITVRGHLKPRWAAWFDGLTITNVADGSAILAGPIVDQAALHSVLLKIRDLGLPLLAVQQLGDPASDRNSPDTYSQGHDREPPQGGAV